MNKWNMISMNMFLKNAGFFKTELGIITVFISIAVPKFLKFFFGSLHSLYRVIHMLKTFGSSLFEKVPYMEGQ